MCRENRTEINKYRYEMSSLKSKVVTSYSMSLMLMLLLMLTTVAASPAIQNDVKQRTSSRGSSASSSSSSATTTTTLAEVPSTSRQQQQPQEVHNRRDLKSASSLYRVNIPSQIKYYFNVHGLMPDDVDNDWTSSSPSAPSTTTTVQPEVEIDSVESTTNDTTITDESPSSSSSSPKTSDEDDDGCTNCGSQRYKTLSDPEIRQMRIDEIKGQILRKLRLETPPNITIPRSMLPTPLMEGEIVLKGQAKFPSRDIEDFYGKMEQVIVMAENDIGPVPPYCQTRHYDPAACFYFKLTDISDRNVESAELWVYKLRDRRDRFNQTYVVSEFVREANNFAQPKSIVGISETDIKSGWIRIDLASTVKRWLSKPRLSIYGLQISCKTCSMNLDEIPVSYDPGEKPFIVINLNDDDGSRARRRNRRSIDCTEGITRCCRESLYVNFSEIGWNDWIVQPTGYYANYCKGSCVEDVAVPLSTSHHTTVMQVLKYYVQKKTALTAQQKAVFAPCCTPTRMSSISLIYQDDKQQILQNNLPNMVVESCGCY